MVSKGLIKPLIKTASTKGQSSKAFRLAGGPETINLFLIALATATSTQPHISLVPRLYPCARTQTNQKCNESLPRFRYISDWSEYERTGKAWERG